MCAQQKSVSKNPSPRSRSFSKNLRASLHLRSTQTWIAPSIMHRFCIHYLITIYYYHMVDQDYSMDYLMLFHYHYSNN